MSIEKNEQELIEFVSDILKVNEGLSEVEKNALINSIKQEVKYYLDTINNRLETKRLHDILPENPEDYLSHALESAGEFLTSSWACLDDVIGGFKKKNLYVVGGRPGMGKTSFIASLICELINKTGVLVNSLEMSTKQFMRV
jgi:replicative DNA helicase